MKDQSKIISLVAGVALVVIGPLLILLRCRHFIGTNINFRVIDVIDLLPGVVFLLPGIKWIRRARTYRHISTDNQ